MISFLYVILAMITMNVWYACFTWIMKRAYEQDLVVNKFFVLLVAPVIVLVTVIYLTIHKILNFLSKE
jgi:hypothetical protein